MEILKFTRTNARRRLRENGSYRGPGRLSRGGPSNNHVLGSRVGSGRLSLRLKIVLGVH